MFCTGAGAGAIKDFGDIRAGLRHSGAEQSMNLPGQFIRQLDAAPLAGGVGRAGDPAALGFTLVEAFAGHLAVDVDLGHGRAGQEGVDEGHDVQAGELGILELDVVGEGTAVIRLGEEMPLVDLNDHKGYGLRVVAERPCQLLAPGSIPAGNNSLGQMKTERNGKEAGRRLAFFDDGGNGEVDNETID